MNLAMGRMGSVSFLVGSFIHKSRRDIGTCAFPCFTVNQAHSTERMTKPLEMKWNKLDGFHDGWHLLSTVLSFVAVSGTLLLLLVEIRWFYLIKMSTCPKKQQWFICYKQILKKKNIYIYGNGKVRYTLLSKRNLSWKQPLHHINRSAIHIKYHTHTNTQ